MLLKLDTKMLEFYSSQLSFVWDTIYKSKIVFIKSTLSAFLLML